MSKKELRNRKIWLFVSTIYFFILPFCRSFLFPHDSFGSFPFLSIQVGFNAIFFAILYYCAYRKQGTFLLTFLLVLGFISFVFSSIVLPFAMIQGLIDFKIFNFKISDILLHTSVYLLWYVSCFKLRKDNKNIQIQTFLSSAEYHKAVESIRSAKDIEDLECKFHEAFRVLPKRFAAVLYPHKEEMKKELSV